MSNKQLYARAVSLLSAFVLFVSAIAACAAAQETTPVPPPPAVTERPAQPPPPQTITPPGAYQPPHTFIEQIAEKYRRNSDTVGWLYVPNTSINDVVLHYPHDANEFYLRRNFDRRTSFSGSYFADFRNTFNGGAQGLSRNTVIYGHSLDLTDNPDAPYFDQLKRFLSEDFARANPYIYFSVADEDLVWQIFAVYYATTSLPYNLPDFTDEGFKRILADMKGRSQFIYDVEVGLDDKILTLSTCTYVFTPGVYPNRYRYVISARLVRAGEERSPTASLQRNPTPMAP